MAAGPVPSGSACAPAIVLGVLRTLATSALLTAARPTGVARAQGLMLILIILLVFVCGLIVILVLRRALRPAARNETSRPAAPQRTAWEEAGRRAEPATDAEREPPDAGPTGPRS